MIKLKNISKVYGKREGVTTALDNVRLDICDNEICAVMGTSGSGKSTLLNIVGCMDKATSGQYLYDDVEVTELNNRQLHSFRKENISFVFQNFALVNRYTVYENIEVPLLARNISARKDKIFKVMEQLGIKELARKFPQELSGGQQQRCAIARAIVTDTKVLLCDEPTGALDSTTGEMIMDTLVQLNELGKTVIVVTHDLAVAKRCKRIISIEDGKIGGGGE